MPSYTYRALADGEFRYIKLHPADNIQNPLHVTLIHSLPVDVEYEAISYTWGETKLTKPLHTEDGDLKIAENLQSALKQFRLANTPRLLWADALCINQENDIEKSKQVELMGSIYKAAKTVLIWLGPLSLHTLWSMEYLQVLAGESDRFGISRPKGKSRVWVTGPQLAGGQKDGVDILESAMLAHAETLYERLWFTRLWIVQESVLAQKLEIWSGEFQMDWIDFELATTLLVAAFGAVGGYPEVMRPILRAWKLIDIRNNYQIGLSGNYAETDTYLSFDVFANDMKFQDCKDDRDRVYGLLSISGAERTMIPDYSKTVAEVYTEFAVKHGGSGMLFDAGLCRRQPIARLERLRVDVGTKKIFARPDYLASWVPDLRKRAETEWRPIFGDVYNTSPTLRGRAFTSPDCPQMYFIHGVRFDYVESWVGLIGEDFKPLDNVTSFFYMTSMLNGFRNALKTEFKTYPTGEKWERAWPLAIATAVPKDFPHPLERYLSAPDALVTDWGLEILWQSYEAIAIEEDGEIYRKIDALETETIPADFSESLSAAARYVWDYHRYLCDVMRRHMIIKTDQGFVGLAPPGVERGDAVAVFGGLKTPFVIRKVFDDESVNLLLGSCYLEGLMDEEIYDEMYKEAFDWMNVQVGKEEDITVPLMAGLIGLV
jgi:Heterokaryon incompatibility protein (HET)